MHGGGHVLGQPRAPLARSLVSPPEPEPEPVPEPEELLPAAETAKAPSRYKRPQPHPTRSGTVRCLSCGAPFASWDRTCNRLCSTCAKRK